MKSDSALTSFIPVKVRHNIDSVMKSNEVTSAAAYNSVKTTEVFTEEEDDNTKKTYDRTKLFNIILIGLVFMTTGSR